MGVGLVIALLIKVDTSFINIYTNQWDHTWVAAPCEPLIALYFPRTKKCVMAFKGRLEQGDTKGKKDGKVSKLGRKMH